jgi:hypothetical protein
MSKGSRLTKHKGNMQHAQTKPPTNKNTCSCFNTSLATEAAARPPGDYSLVVPTDANSFFSARSKVSKPSISLQTIDICRRDPNVNFSQGRNWKIGVVRTRRGDFQSFVMWRSVLGSCFWTIGFVWKRTFDIQSFVMWRSVLGSCFWTIGFVWKRTFDIQSFVMWRSVLVSCFWTIGFVWKRTCDIQSFVMWRSVLGSCCWTIGFVWKRTFDIQSFVMWRSVLGSCFWTIGFARNEQILPQILPEMF